MSTIRDISGNGFGVNLDPGVNNILPSGADVTVPAKTTYMRAKGAGNIVYRPPGQTADITLTVVDGERVPVQAGTIIRNSGTTVTALHSFHERADL